MLIMTENAHGEREYLKLVMKEFSHTKEDLTGLER